MENASRVTYISTVIGMKVMEGNVPNLHALINKDLIVLVFAKTALQVLRAHWTVNHATLLYSVITTRRLLMENVLINAKARKMLSFTKTQVMRNASLSKKRVAWRSSMESITI